MTRRSIPTYPTPGLRPVLGGVIGGSTVPSEGADPDPRAARRAAREQRRDARRAKRDARRAARDARQGSDGGMTQGGKGKGRQGR